MNNIIAELYFELLKTQSKKLSNELISSTIGFSIAYSDENNLSTLEMSEYLNKQLNDLLTMAKNKSSRSIA